jgi:Domain of unknown function (DUF3850)
MQIHHYLKTHLDTFQAVKSGIKTAEFRLNDRDFKVNDILVLQEYDPASYSYSGDYLVKEITHIQEEYGIPDGYVMLSIKDTV